MPLFGKKSRGKDEEQLLNDDHKKSGYGAFGSKEEEKPEPQDTAFETKPVSLLKLYRYCEGWDTTLLIVAISMSVLKGMGWPLQGIIYGAQTNVFMDAQMAYDAHNFFPEDVQVTSSTTSYTKDRFAFNNDNSTDNEIYVPVSSPEIFLDGVTQAAIRYSIVGSVVLIAGWIEMTCWLVLCERQIYKIRKEFFRSILHQDIAWFDAHQSGEMTTRLSDNLERMKEGMGDKMALLIEYMCSCIGGFIVAFIFSWKLTLVVIVGAPLLGLGCGLAMTLVDKAAREETARNSEAGVVAEEVLSNIRTVIAFNGQEQECHRYKSFLEKAQKAGLRRSLLVGIDVAYAWMIIFCIYALTFWYGAIMLNRGEIDRGGVFTVLLSVFTGAFNLADAGPQLAVVSAARGAAASIFQIIEREPVIDSYSKEGKKLSKVMGKVQLKDVSFRYPSRKTVQVLDNVNLTVEPGETVALVGSSGSGKSTIVNLLLRYYDPSKGEVTIDDQPIDEFNIAFLRNLIGVVSQEPVLFETTIEENIRFGRMDITRQEMVEAAKMANAHAFIVALPDGYNTIAGERGTQLSGGQKQRIAIARALVRDPKILLLDEATSALDAESEGIVQEALDKAAKGRTTIVVAHRLSTIKQADRIFVMQHGKIMEVGQHSELMEKKGIYQQLVNTQLFEDSGSGYISADETLGSVEPGIIGHCTENAQNVDLPVATQDNFNNRNSLSLSRPLSMSITSLTSEDFYISDKRKSRTDEQISEQKRLQTALREEGLEPASFYRIMKENADEWPSLVLGLIGTFIRGASRPVYSLCYGYVFKDFTKQGLELQESMNFWAVIFLIIGGVQSIASVAASFFFGVTSERLACRLRMKVFRNVLRQNVAYFDDPKHSTGKIATRLATDAPNVKAATDFRLAQVLATVIYTIGGAGLALAIGWQMALLGFALLPVSGAAFYLAEKMRSGKQKEDARMMEEAGKTSSESIQNIRTVQALTREKDFCKTFCRQLQKPFQHGVRRAAFQGVTYGFAGSVTMFFYAASFRFGGFLVFNRIMEPITVYRVFTALLFTSFALRIMTAYLPEYVKAKFSAALIFKMIREKPKIDNLCKTGLKPEVTGSMTFKDVHFAYPMRPDAKVLKGMAFKVDVGQTLAMVGASGCGKSTCVSLIERFYDPVKGYIMLDDYDLKTVNPAYIRNQISLVSQEPTLFDCTITENITYGLSDVAHEKVVEAAKLANIHNFIVSLPLGYKTKVGEKGTQLSGGQKQRVAIARALVRSPRILLLDEATSALDAESEQIVQQALDQARKGRTCIIIAHRLSTVQTADIIAVVKHGIIIEQGSHAQLIAQRGAYFHLTKKQAVSS